MVGELDGRGQHDCRADGDHPEGQSLLHQVRLALAFPSPAGKNVTHRRASDPRRQCRLASSETHWAEAYGQGDLACRDRSHRNQQETAEPLPKVAPEPTFRGRDDPGRCQNHVSPSFVEVGRLPGRQTYTVREPPRREAGSLQRPRPRYRACARTAGIVAHCGSLARRQARPHPRRQARPHPRRQARPHPRWQARQVHSTRLPGNMLLSRPRTPRGYSGVSMTKCAG